MTKLTGKNYSSEQHLLTISVNKLNKKTKKLTLTIIQIIYEIWVTRNNIKYDKTLIPENKIITKINTQIRNIIQTHYKYHKLNDTLQTFAEQFRINHALAKVENEQLTHNLQPYPQKRQS